MLLLIYVKLSGSLFAGFFHHCSGNIPRIKSGLIAGFISRLLKYMSRWVCVYITVVRLVRYQIDCWQSAFSLEISAGIIRRDYLALNTRPCDP